MFLCVRIINPLFTFCLTTVHLDIVYRIGTEILKHDIAVLVEEFLTVQKQRLHFLTVHLDLPIAVKLHSGKLGYQGIKHRSFGKLKCIGIVDQRIAFMKEFHFRDHHLHLSEFMRLTHELGQWHLALQFALAQAFDLIHYCLRCVSRTPYLKHIGRILVFSHEFDIRHVPDMI